MTDKLLFYTSLVENLDQSRCQLHVAANQLAEAVIESVQVSVVHMEADILVNIGSGNGSSPVRRQAIN